jgi:hypothetical protein
MRISVTRDDINNGWPLMPHACPIARAVKRLGFTGVLVASDISTDQGVFDLPPSARYFIVNNDQTAFSWFGMNTRERGNLEPFEFTAIPVPA